MGAIGKIDVSYESKLYLISLVKWGFLRKFVAKIFRANPFPFIPSYEIMIFEKKVGNVDLNSPLFVFHFADKETFKRRIEWAKLKISSGGLKPLIESFQYFDLDKEGIYFNLTDKYGRKAFY